MLSTLSEVFSFSHHYQNYPELHHIHAFCFEFNVHPLQPLQHILRYVPDSSLFLLPLHHRGPLIPVPVNLLFPDPAYPLPAALVLHQSVLLQSYILHLPLSLYC